jgi:hypothetical protein
MVAGLPLGIVRFDHGRPCNWEINLGVGEGLTDGSNRLIAKTIVGFR